MSHRATGRPRGRPPGRGNKPKPTRAERNIAWIEKHCRVPEGKDLSKRLVLREWQRHQLRLVYDNPAGTRRAIISFGRKNAKSTLAACLLLLHLVGPEYRANSQLYSAAQSRDQAAVIFGLASKIVRLSPTLRDFVQVRDAAKQLFCPELGTLYRALSAEVATAYGLSPVFIIHDELGLVQGNRSQLFDALETATGAQENPLSVIISTQAPTDNDLLSILIDDALAAHDPRVVVSLYTAPQELDPFAESTIRLANPAFGDFLNATEVLGMAEDARRMPARESEYRNLILNQRVESSSPFVSPSLWKACGAPVDELEGMPVYMGLDLSATQDLTAAVMIGRINGVWHVRPTFWLPGEGLREKAHRDRVPYDQWRDSGFLVASPGASVDYEFVAKWLRDQFEHYDIAKVAFDKWNFRHLRPWLIAAGFSEDKIARHFVEYAQTLAAFTPALRELESDILNKRIAHGNHPVLTMCAMNAVCFTDGNHNRKLMKDRSRGRIDGMVALTMARGVVPEKEMQPAPSYQMMVVG